MTINDAVLTRRSLLIGAGALAGLAITATAAPISARADSDDAVEIQTLFDAATAGSTITIPPREYVLEGHLLLPQASDVTVVADGAVFTGGTVHFYAGGHSGLTWRGGRFAGDGTRGLVFAFLSCENYVFQDVEFDQVQPFGWHIFDLIGCTNVVFDRITVRGYGTTTDLSATSLYNWYKEAIQIDYAYRGASGGAAFDDMLEAVGGTFDGSASTGITVKNSTFVPARDSSGDVISWAPCPLGQHAYSPNTQNARITFRNNVVSDPIPLNSLDGAWPRGALHFVPIVDLSVLGNTFESTVSATQRENWIQIVCNADGRLPDPETMLPSTKIKIVDNAFTGQAATESYVRLQSNKDHPNYRIDHVVVTGNRAVRGDASPAWVETLGVQSQFSHIVEAGNKTTM